MSEFSAVIRLTNFLYLFIIFLIVHQLDGQTINMYNWAGTFQYGTQNIQWPRSIAQVKHIVKNAKKLRCLGQRHSFSLIADSNDTILANIGLKNILNPLLPAVQPLDGIIPIVPPIGPLTGINPLDPTVIAEAGITYTDLAPFLQYIGYALENLASLGELSLAGGTQTGAHGSGNTLGCLSTQIRSMQIVRADGILEEILPGGPRLKALAVGLGAFGVITSMELALVPSFNVTTYVFLNLPHNEFMQYFDDIMAAGYSVQVFADFLMSGFWNQVFVIERSDANSNIGTQEFLPNTSARRTTQQKSPLIFLPPTYLSMQSVEQPWHFGLVDLQLGFLAPGEYENSLSGIFSEGDEIQTEYFVAHENATKAIDAVYKYSELLAPLLWVALIRTVKCDDLWMSMCRCRHAKDDYAVAIDLIFKPSFDLVNPVLALVEADLIQFGARPHWGKYFLMGPEHFLHTYEMREEFINLAKEFDPKGKFRNEFMDKNVFMNTTSGNGGGGLLDDILGQLGL